MIKYNESDLKDMLAKEPARYRAEIGDMAPDERKSLREWVKSGCSAYDNPCGLCQENGHPFDYITALRINGDMMNNPKGYSLGPNAGSWAGDKTIPF